MKVHELMSTEVVTATAESSLKEVARLMLANEISGVPIVGDDRRLVGIVTEADILHYESLRVEMDGLGLLPVMREQTESAAADVGETMSDYVVTTSPDVDHTVAARLMETRAVKRLPVVDAEGHLVGIISRSDIMKSFARPDELIEDEIRIDIIERILWLETDTVEVKSLEGRVTLSGAVPRKTDARILEELSRRLDGVVDVDSSGMSYEIDDTKAGQAGGGAALRHW